MFAHTFAAAIPQKRSRGILRHTAANFHPRSSSTKYFRLRNSTPEKSARRQAHACCRTFVSLDCMSSTPWNTGPAASFRLLGHRLSFRRAKGASNFSVFSDSCYPSVSFSARYNARRCRRNSSSGISRSRRSPSHFFCAKPFAVSPLNSVPASPQAAESIPRWTPRGRHPSRGGFKIAP